MSHQRETANTLYRALLGEAVSAPDLDRARAWFGRQGTPLDDRSFAAYMHALQDGLDADSPLAALVPKWRRAYRDRVGFDERSAASFLQDYTSHLDPNLLFQATITAGFARWDQRRLEQGFAYGSQSEQAWSLLCVDGGGARLRAGGRDLALATGQVLLVEPGALYSLHPLHGHRHWAYHWVVFHPDSRWRDWLRWPHFATHVSHLRLPAEAQDTVIRLFRELDDSLRSSRDMAMELSHNLLEQVILRCRAQLPPGFQLHLDPRVERARADIEGHYHQPFTLATVASAASMSASRLASLFKAQCGLSVMGYRDELRMVRAAQLLRNHAMGIAAVGEAVGYPDPAYFSRTFSRHVGVSPREYRRQG